MIESVIYADFEGWTGDTIFKLDNGQYWKQVSFAYRYYYAFRPSVRIVLENGVYQLHVDGVDDAIAVQLVDVVADTQITNDFEGWDGETIFQLANGETWQQSAPAVVVSVAVWPNALIYCDVSGFKLRVGRVSSEVQVRRIE